MGGRFVVQSVVVFTGVLHLGGIDWHTLVDGWVMVAQFAVVAQIVVGVMVVVMGLFLVMMGLFVMVFGHIVTMAGGLGVGGSVGSLGVLHGGCVDWDAVVDHRHVVVVSRPFVMVVLLRFMVVWVFGGFCHGRKMFGAGMLYFNWFYRDSVLDDWIVISIFAIVFLIVMIFVVLVFVMGLFVVVPAAQIMTVRIPAGLGNGRKVFSLGVGHFGGFLHLAILADFSVSAMVQVVPMWRRRCRSND
jgi:hypothetical protein